MKIVLHEMRKIWNLKSVVMLALLCGLFYAVFLSSYVNNYPNGHPNAENVALSTALTIRYGPTLEPEELEEYVAETRPGLIAAADQFIAESSNLAEMGIRDYASLRESVMELSYDTSDEAIAGQLAILREFYGLAESGESMEEGACMPLLQYEIAALDDLVSMYEFVLDPSRLLEYSQNWSTEYRTRFEEKISTDEFRGILPEHTLSTTRQYAQGLVMLVILATLLCFSPLLATDRMRKVHLLQYTSKQGRGVIGKQITAVLISSIILTTALLVVFSMIFATNGTQVFWNNYVSSFNSLFGTTIRITFGQYICVLALMMYLIGAALSTFVFILSRFSANYINLIAGLIPVFIASAILSDNLFRAPLNDFRFGMALFEPFVCITALMIGFGAAICIVWKERRIDVA
ncbi:MAG: hypothetical protein FWG30_03790 [Eubacteriaceae bacterium]|nr:hypothetical protein [Eubacteriaceae bacterium]